MQELVRSLLSQSYNGFRAVLVKNYKLLGGPDETGARSGVFSATRPCTRQRWQSIMTLLNMQIETHLLSRGGFAGLHSRRGDAHLGSRVVWYPAEQQACAKLGRRCSQTVVQQSRGWGICELWAVSFRRCLSLKTLSFRSSATPCWARTLAGLGKGCRKGRLHHCGLHMHRAVRECCCGAAMAPPMESRQSQIPHAPIRQLHYINTRVLGCERLRCLKNMLIKPLVSSFARKNTSLLLCLSGWLLFFPALLQALMPSIPPARLPTAEPSPATAARLRCRPFSGRCLGCLFRRQWGAQAVLLVQAQVGVRHLRACKVTWSHH